MKTLPPPRSSCCIYAPPQIHEALPLPRHPAPTPRRTSAHRRYPAYHNRRAYQETHSSRRSRASYSIEATDKTPFVAYVFYASLIFSVLFSLSYLFVG